MALRPKITWDWTSRASSSSVGDAGKFRRLFFGGEEARGEEGRPERGVLEERYGLVALRPKITWDWTSRASSSSVGNAGKFRRLFFGGEEARGEEGRPERGVLEEGYGLVALRPKITWDWTSRASSSSVGDAGKFRRLFIGGEEVTRGERGGEGGAWEGKLGERGGIMGLRPKITWDCTSRASSSSVGDAGKFRRLFFGGEEVTRGERGQEGGAWEGKLGERGGLMGLRPKITWDWTSRACSSSVGDGGKFKRLFFGGEEAARGERGRILGERKGAFDGEEVARGERGQEGGAWEGKLGERGGLMGLRPKITWDWTSRACSSSVGDGGKFKRLFFGGEEAARGERGRILGEREGAEEVRVVGLRPKITWD